MKIRFHPYLPGVVITQRIGRVHLELDTHHWTKEGTQHGPCSMPVLFDWKWCTLDGRREDFLARRLWLYFRGGYACHFDFIADRRPV